jgi:FAD:protein FMN transferase
MAASVVSREHWPTAFSLIRTDAHWTGRFVAMACPCEVLIEHTPEEQAREIVAAVARCAWRIEKKFSRYRGDSVVHAINTSVGRPMEVDDETARLLDFAATLTRLSEGRFDITSGVLRRVWTFDGGSHLPTQKQIDNLMQLVGWSKVCWQRPILSLSPGMELDFGGIGKEYAVDAAAELADRLAPGLSCLINLGGDVAVRNARADGAAWRVGVETVHHAGSAAGVIQLHQGALATSGDSRRFVLRDGHRYSHILDARTGWPVRDAPRSITVAADTCSQAGSLTTLAMLEGAGARRFLEASGNRYWVQ